MRFSSLLANTKITAALGVAACLALPSLAGAQSYPSYAVAPQQSIKGTVTGFNGAYTMYVDDAKGYSDNIQMHDGTVINPTGIKLQEGMRVTVYGYANGPVFQAYRIDTEVSYNPSPYDGYPAYGGGYGYGGYGGYGYGGYGYGGFGYGGYGYGGFGGWYPAWGIGIGWWGGCCGWGWPGYYGGYYGGPYWYRGPGFFHDRDQFFRHGTIGAPVRGGFGAPVRGGYGGPRSGGFGAPPRSGGFGAPVRGGYGAPRSGGFGAGPQRGGGAPRSGPPGRGTIHSGRP